MRAAVASVALSVLALGACTPDGRQGEESRRLETLVPAASVEQARRGKALVEELECVRCHQVPEVEPAPPDKNCVGCHQRIEAGTYEAEPAVLSRWQAHVEHLTLTPDLAGAVRLRREWIEQFVQSPHDVRSGLEATMPRLKIAPDQAAALAAFLSPAPEHVVEIAGDVARGRAQIEQRECGSCHVLDGFADPGVVPPRQAGDAARLAPDLRHARTRMRPDLLLQWLRNPGSIHARTLMPATAMTLAQAEDVAAFLLRAPLKAAAAGEPEPRLPVLERSVTFAEVDAAVFKRTCWHCHSDPAFAPGGDGGPGNTGGLGFAGRGLDLSSLATMSAGARDDEGERRSIFRKLEDGTPALVAHLDARRMEEAGRVIEGVRGMPLGLPALSREQIQLVESWIAQGRPE